MWRRLDPRPPARRLVGAWRVGRLRAALPRLAEHLLDQADADLEAVPPLTELTNRQIIGLLHRSQAVLRALHAHEILMGMLTDTGRNRMTGAAVALRVLAEARQEGLTDTEILERSPVVLALAPPRVAPVPMLPAEALTLSLGEDQDNANDNGILREALRLRVRWVQELSGRAAWELGERLARSGDLPDPALIRHMNLEHVEAVATRRAVIVPSLVRHHEHDFGAPLPAWFQLSDLRFAIAVKKGDEVGRRHRRRRRIGSRTGHLRRGRPARRGRCSSPPRSPPASAPALPAQRHRRRDRLGAVAPRDPRPRGRGGHGGRLRRRRSTTCPRAPWSSVDGDTGSGHHRRARRPPP